MAHRVEALVFYLGVLSLIPKTPMMNLTTIICHLTSTHTHPQRKKEIQ